jgi:hypothetical protein
MGLDGLKEPMRFSGLLDVSFPLPESEIVFQAKARIVWIGDESRVGLRFAVIDPVLFEQLQHWTNKKTKAGNRRPSRRNVLATPTSASPNR